jgi:hypothetical protein
MNDIVWSKRNSLHIATVSNLMFVILNGPSLEHFDPLPYVQSWIATGKRLSTSWVPGPSASIKESEHSILLRGLINR